jgi:hypothetical protein
MSDHKRRIRREPVLLHFHNWAAADVVVYPRKIETGDDCHIAPLGTLRVSSLKPRLAMLTDWNLPIILGFSTRNELCLDVQAACRISAAVFEDVRKQNLVSFKSICCERSANPGALVSVECSFGRVSLPASFARCVYSGGSNYYRQDCVSSDANSGDTGPLKYFFIVVCAIGLGGFVLCTKGIYRGNEIMIFGGWIIAAAAIITISVIGGHIAVPKISELYRVKLHRQ